MIVSLLKKLQKYPISLVDAVYGCSSIQELSQDQSHQSTGPFIRNIYKWHILVK